MAVGPAGLQDFRSGQEPTAMSSPDWVREALASTRLLSNLSEELMDQLAPKASFIPEIWQGHKNNGEGAWLALERLEGCVDSSQQRQVA